MMHRQRTGNGQLDLETIPIHNIWLRVFSPALQGTVLTNHTCTVESHREGHHIGHDGPADGGAGRAREGSPGVLVDAGNPIGNGAQAIGSESIAVAIAISIAPAGEVSTALPGTATALDELNLNK